MAPSSPAQVGSTAPAGGGQVFLDFSPRQAAPARRTRPARPPREHAVEERLKLALRLLLEGRHVGLEQAATWEALRDELVAEGLPMTVTRRLQEAAEQLLDEGVPVVGLSSSGVCLARTADEVERSLRESEKRARKTLRRRSRLRRVWLQMLGQERLPRPVDDGRTP